MNDQQVPPVQTGEVYTVSIDAVGGKGDGIAKVKGFVVFVPGVQKGDYVKIRITKVLPKVGFAELLEKTERPSGSSRYATVTEKDLQSMKGEEQTYEDTEDFGEH